MRPPASVIRTILLAAFLAAEPTAAAWRGTTLLDRAAGTVVAAVPAPGRPDELFVVERSGIVRILDLPSATLRDPPFLDLTSRVDTSGGEQGLLGLAFHPDFERNGRFFVNYVEDPGPGLDRTRVDAFQVADPAGDTSAPAGSLTPVLSFPQDFSNHNGGWLAFGPDGYLYVSSGDGGGGNDPNDRAQSLDTLLGKLLRIDVDGDDFPADPDRNYRIPAGNPWAGDGNAGTRDELWAYGLRNPWRASFDRATGDLWIGDVGQGAREEIDLLPAGAGGGANFGWRLREGTIATPGAVGGPEPIDHVPPVYDYPSDGAGAFAGNSVVGGFVYRGPDPELGGLYLFADSFPKRLWTFDPGDPYGTVADVRPVLDPEDAIGAPVAFGEDAAGNLYVLTLDGGIWRVDTDAPPSASRVPLPAGGLAAGLLALGSMLRWRRGTRRRAVRR